MKKTIDVVAALIFKECRVLIAKRDTGDESVLGKWEFPGGKVEPGESETNAIEREIKEEFELDIKAEKFITNNICEYPTKIVNLKLYKCNYVSGDFNLHDHSEYKYVRLEELLNYDLAPADIPLAKYVKELEK
jgi:8-oxo-dGTP diphosphatase